LIVKADKWAFIAYKKAIELIITDMTIFVFGFIKNISRWGEALVMPRKWPCTDTIFAVAEENISGVVYVDGTGFIHKGDDALGVVTGTLIG
jgi:hypothetical protein